MFGKVVGGLDVLKKLETIPVDAKDRPEREIRIKQIQMFVDPFEEYQTRLKKKLAHEANADAEGEEARLKREKEDRMGWFGPSVSKKNGNTEEKTIGKYMQETTTKKREAIEPQEDIGVSQKKQKVLLQQQQQKSSGYGNFDHF